MYHQAHQVSLGFTNQTFPPGVHICQIYSDHDERLDSLLKFLCSGLAAGERTACFTDNLADDLLAAHLLEHGVSHADCVASGALSKQSAKEVYFQNHRFDPDRMLDLLKAYHGDAEANGFPAARIIGEMDAGIQKMEGGSRLMEYESRVSLLLREHPITAVCQYNANTFDGAMIMNILKVHPLMVIRGAVVHNPFYLQPEELLSKQGCA